MLAVLFLKCSVAVAALVALVALPRPASSLAADFDGYSPQSISMVSDSDWDGFSSSMGTTVEAWVKFNNPVARWSTIVGYSTLTPLSKVGKSKEISFVVGDFAGATAMSWLRGNEMVYCFQCSTAFQDGYWHHIVASMDYATGDTAYYVNGTLLAAQPGVMAGDNFRTVPRRKGVVFVGIAMDAGEGADGGVVALQLSSHSLDDIRIHNRVLSPEEVAAGAWRLPADMSDAYRESLRLHWSFDEPHPTTEIDLSGHEAHGTWGAVDDVNGVNVTYREQQLKVTRPATVQGLPPDTVLSAMNVSMFAPVSQSRMEIPLPGDTSSSAAPVVVMSLNESIKAGQWLWSDSGSGSLTPPLPGQSLEPRGHLFFQPAASLTALPENDPAAELWCQMGDRAFSVRVYRPPECSPPRRSFSGTHGTHLLIPLGNRCGDGIAVQTEILAPPTRGKLFEFVPKMQLWPFFNPLEPQSIGNEVLDFPFTVGNPWGALVFIDSELSPDSSPEVSLEYRWLSSSSADRSANVTISYSYVDQPPELQGTSLTPWRAATGIKIQLESVSKRWAPNGDAITGNRYLIRRSPAFGDLYQVLDDVDLPIQVPGPQMNAFGLSTMLYKQYASEVPPYSTVWGPAVSSTPGQCPECCTYRATCNPQNCAAVGHEDFNRCMMDTSVETLLGPPPASWPNVSPDIYYKNWRPVCSNCGPQWFVVGFPTPVHATSLEIAEFSRPGSVIRISVATVYAGNQTEWVNVWSGQPQDLPDEPRIFTPSICSAIGLLTKWVRVDLQTDNSEKLPGIASVALLGTREDRVDMVTSPDGEILYRPTPGISVIDGAEFEDSFEVEVSDCSSGSSAPETVEIPMAQWRAAASTLDTAFFGSMQEAQAVVGEPTEVTIVMEEAIEHLSAAFGRSIAPEEFSLEVIPCSCFEISLPNGSQVVQGVVPAGQKDNEFDPELCERDLSTGHLDLGAQGRFMVKSLHQGVMAHNFAVTATALNVTYTLGLEVALVCPQDASIYDCADGPEVCAAAARAAFDPVSRTCVQGGAASSIVGGVFITVLVTIVVILIVMGYLLFCLRARMAYRLLGRFRPPPGKGEMVTLVITDIQGSTTLWDKYPDQMVKDIALHHSILRGVLHRYNGYEVATEGDSFKCAFSTPEDAVLWCMVVQLELHGAQWTPQLENGGREVLSTVRYSWASESGDSSLPQHVITNICLFRGD